MKRLLLLALFLIGCGVARPLDEGTTTWSVKLGSWESPTCQGTMTLAPNHAVEQRGMPAAFVGSWTCGSLGGQASGDIRPDDSVFLNLETTPGFLNGVRGTLAADDAISGDILLDGQNVPFAAYRQ